MTFNRPTLKSLWQRLLGRRDSFGGSSRRRRLSTSASSVVEVLEDRTLLAVNILRAGGTNTDEFALNVLANGSLEVDREHLPSQDLPINFSREFSVPSATSGTASGSLTGTVEELPDGSVREVTMSLGVTGVRVSGVGVSGWPPNRRMSGRYSFAIEVTDAPVTVTFAGTQHTVHHPFVGQVNLDVNAAGFAPIALSTNDINGLPTHDPLEQSFERTITLNPATYTIDFEVHAWVGHGDSSGDSRIDFTMAIQSPPVVNEIGHRSVIAGETLSFTADAVDPDGDNLTFTLDDASLAAGMTIDSSTGDFSWTPDISLAGDNFAVTVTVTDDGSPSLSTEESFSISVQKPPFRWTNAGGGDFQTDGNWNVNDVPETFDRAIIDLPGQYTVALSENQWLQLLQVGGPGTNATLLHDEFRLYGPLLQVGYETGDVSSLTIGSNSGTPFPGAEVRFVTAVVGVENNADGTLVVSGPTARFAVDSHLTVAADAKGTLKIENGAEVAVQTAGLSIGAGRLEQNIIGGSNGDGDVTVTGTGSMLTAPILSIANNHSGSVGLLKVLDGGEAVFEQGHIGDSAGPLNQVPPPGAGNSAGSVEVRGGVLRFTRSFADDVVNFVPSFDVEQGVALVIGGAGRVEVDGTTDFSTVVSRTVVVGMGQGPQAELEVIGSGAAFDADTIFVSPVYDSPGAFRVKDGAIAHSDSLHLTGRSHLSVSQGGKLTTSADATIGSSFTVLSGGTPVAGDLVHANAAVTGAGSVWEVDGNLTVQGGGPSPQGSGVLQIDNGGTLIVSTLNLQQGGVLQGDGLIKGTLQGNGVNNFAGQILPGNSPGTLTIDGNYTQGADGTLVLEIGGSTPGTQYDQLVVTGDVQLDGTLEIVFVDGYVPAMNETFDFIVAGTIGGQFDDVMVQGLPAGTEVEFDPVTGDLTVTSGDEPDEPGHPPDMPTFGAMPTTTSDATPAIVFHVLPAAETYDVRIYDIARGQEVFAQDGLQSTSVSPATALRAAAHQAFVRAANSAGVSQWAGPFVFHVVEEPGVAPAAPTIVAPEHSSEADTPEFVWSPVDGADAYELVVYNVRLGQEVLRAGELVGLDYTPESSLANDRHQAFVRAINSAGAGSWSEPRLFDVLAGDRQISAQPQLVEPIGVPGTTTPRFRWNALPGVTDFELLVYHVDTGREVARRVVTGAEHTFAQAFQPGQHQAFVRPLHTTRPGLWSNPEYFTIGAEDPDSTPPSSLDMEEVLSVLAGGE